MYNPTVKIFRGAQVGIYFCACTTLNVFVYICVYMSLCAYICVYVSLYIHALMYVSVSECVCMCLYLQYINSKSKTFLVLTREPLYADNIDFVTHTKYEQVKTDRFSAAYDVFSLTISLKYTKVMSMLAPGDYGALCLCVKHKIMYAGYIFKLRSILSGDCSLNSEIIQKSKKQVLCLAYLRKSYD